MKQYYFAALCLVCFFQAKNAISQNLTAPCGADYCREVALQDPEFFQKNEAFEQAILKVFEQKKINTGQPEQAKILPTVVHIIHDGGAENISDAQVQQAIQWLNQALANQGSFNQGSGADCGIQLCLAQRTPDGLPTNGITRNQSPLTAMQLESQDLQVKNLNRWNPKDYVNIWLVRSICSNNYGCGVYGYAYYPFSHGSTIDGIVMEAGYVTEIGKVSGLAHEMGHYLGLYHTFEGGCTNNNCLVDGDRICDTPPDQSTAGVPCGNNLSSCSTDTQSGPYTTDQPDMSWNFMDYGILNCFHDYTPDQAIRMNAAVDGARKSLLDSKGCLPPCLTPTLAGFTPSSTNVAVGETVTFSNTSQNASTYVWTVNNTPFGNQPDASYTFLSPGIYSIALSAQPANSSLCSADLAQVTIQVYCPVTASFTLSDSGPDVNETIFTTNTSLNTTQTTWFINGVNQGSLLDSIAFSQPGAYEIRLETGNGFCADTTTDFVYVQVVCVQKTFEYEIRTEDYTAPISSITALVEGNLILTGSGAVTGDDYPVFVKMKPDGQVLWTKKIGFDSTSQVMIDAKATPDGGFVAFYGEDKFLPGNRQHYLVKFSADGVLIWAQKIDWDSTIPPYLLAHPDGNIVIAGTFLAKLSSTGVLLWAKNYPNIKCLSSYPDGGFLALDGNYVIRFDEFGNILWRRLIEVTPSIEITSLLAVPDGNIFVIGNKGADLPTVRHATLFKMDPFGETIWSKAYRQIPVSTYRFESMTLSATGNLVIAGSAQADNPGPGGLYYFSILLEIDLDGEVKWSRHRSSYSFTSSYNRVIRVPGGGYALIKDNLFILKTDEVGQTLGCPEDPHEINVSPFDFTNILDAPIILDTFLLTTPVVLPTADLLWLVDTLCVPTCAQTFEICNNNLDDDGDGLFDCLDPDCNCTEDKCAPKQGNIWYFGQNAGLDFSTEPPIVLTDGNTQAFGISATQCDVNGAILFYSDGKRVYNRFNEVMPNGTLQNITGAHHSIIIPNLDKIGQYHLMIETNSGDIESFTIDMTLDNGKGDIVGSFLYLPECTGVAVTKTCNEPGFWFLTHKTGQNSTFLVFSKGINGTSSFNLTGPLQFVMSIKQLKISPDGSRVACTYYSNALFNTTVVAVYDFDPLEGLITNLRELATYNSAERVDGVEFSPSGRFLYVTGDLSEQAKLVQYDLEAGDLDAVQSSRVVLASQANPGTAYPQLAPNGKIYIPSGSSISPLVSTLDVIHQPDMAGLLCKYQAQAQSLANASGIGKAPTGLCNVISSNLGKAPRIAFSYNAPDTICALNTPMYYQMPYVPCSMDSLIWTVENLDVQVLNAGNSNAIIRYLNPGSGRLIATAHTPCGIATDTLNVLVVAPLTQTINLGPDLVVCQNGVFSFNAGSGFAKYLWSDGTADSTVTTLFPGTYWVKAWDLCGNVQTDTITVSIAPSSVLDLGPDLPQQCSGFSVNYQRPANFESWQWSPNDFLSCADCPNVTISPAASTHWIIVGQTAEGCISVDTLNATIRDTLLFSRDTFVCVGETLALFGTQLPADTTAEFFLPAPALGCDTLLTVNVLGIDNAASQVVVRICADAFFAYNGVLLPADTVAVFHLSSALACDSAVTVRVNAYPALTLSLPMDTTIRIGASVLLDAELLGTGTLDFVWTPTDGLSCFACPDPLANPLDTITYTLSVTDMNGCTAQESVTVRVNEECRVRIPNAFTPNGDGSNEVFRPVLDPCVRTVRLWKIMNRWGQTVFEQVNFSASDPNLGWDGNWEGKPQPSDLLIWVAEFEYFDGRREAQSGEVSLIR